MQKVMMVMRMMSMSVREASWLTIDSVLAGNERSPVISLFSVLLQHDNVAFIARCPPYKPMFMSPHCTNVMIILPQRTLFSFLKNETMDLLVPAIVYHESINQNCIVLSDSLAFPTC